MEVRWSLCGGEVVYEYLKGGASDYLRSVCKGYGEVWYVKRRHVPRSSHLSLVSSKALGPGARTPFSLPTGVQANETSARVLGR